MLEVEREEHSAGLFKRSDFKLSHVKAAEED